MATEPEQPDSFECWWCRRHFDAKPHYFSGKEDDDPDDFPVHLLFFCNDCGPIIDQKWTAETAKALPQRS